MTLLVHNQFPFDFMRGRGGGRGGDVQCQGRDCSAGDVDRSRELFFYLNKSLTIEWIQQHQLMLVPFLPVLGKVVHRHQSFDGFVEYLQLALAELEARCDHAGSLSMLLLKAALASSKDFKSGSEYIQTLFGRRNIGASVSDSIEVCVKAAAKRQPERNDAGNSTGQRERVRHSETRMSIVFDTHELGFV